MAKSTRAETSQRERVGVIKVHPDGYGFVRSLDADGNEDGEDVYVNARARAGALDGDKVSVAWWQAARGLEGEVRGISERGRARLTGELPPLATGRPGGRGDVLQPDDPRIVNPVRIRGGTRGAAPGQSLLAEIVAYPDGPNAPIEVTISRVLGDNDDPRTEVEKVLVSAGVEPEFPKHVERLARGMPDSVRPGDLTDRTDLRHVPFTTIDPATARDFDDAVALETSSDGGQRLWVAVADVSHYVRQGDPIDKEAIARGCSIYLPDRAIPMLPEQLSSHICSLLPHQDRLAMVARIDFDRTARIVGTEFCAAVIHSQERMDYPGVAAALSGHLQGRNKLYEPWVPSLERMTAFAKVLRAKRFERGALDLDLPEPVVELDQDDPRRIRDVRRSRNDPGERGAYAMIEEFMLAANEAVARSFTDRKEETLWRVHGVPSQEKLQLFADLAESYGVACDIGRLTSPKGLGQVLAELKGHSAEKALSFQLLRSLKQATYDIVNVGHFGLAAPDYVHFTSPIRRYPDLVVHRQLKQRLAAEGKPSGGFAGERFVQHGADLTAVATQASTRERKAMEIDREATDVYRTFFMRERVGDAFEGVISGVTAFGVFVTLDHPFVEGLIRLEDLPPDHYAFDEKTLRISGARTGLVLTLGQTVKVEVASVSVQRRKIDFRLEGTPERAANAPRFPRQLPPRRTLGRDDRRLPVRGHARSERQDRGGSSNRSGADKGRSKTKIESPSKNAGPDGRPGERPGSGERPGGRLSGRPGGGRPGAGRPGGPGKRSGRKRSPR